VTLKEKVQEATELIQKYTNLQQKDNQVKQYETLLARIEELKPVAQNTAQSFAALSRHSPESFTIFQSLAIEQLRQINNELRAGAYPNTEIKSLEITLTKQEESLQEGWKKYMHQLSSSTENTLGVVRVH
jgi:hypothetical protein